MSITKVISVVLNLLGALLCLLAIIAGGASAAALVERMQHGRGGMFADVEFLALAAVVLLVPGAALLMAARRLARRASREKSESTV
jgi:hypothetical protein